MNSSDFRLEARNKLKGKWGNAVGVVFTFILFTFLANLIIEILPGYLGIILNVLFVAVEVPILYGFTYSFLNLYNTQNTFSFNFLELFELGFSNIKRAWSVKWYIILKTLLPLVILIILLIALSYTSFVSFVYLLGTYSNPNNYDSFTSFSTISAFLLLAYFIVEIWLCIKLYHYALADFIAIENPNMSAKEAVQKSEELMQGNRLKLFILHLSFIGWIILTGFTYGIGLLWLIPYMTFATIAFYKFLVKDTSSDIYVSDYNNIDNTNNNTDIM